MIEFNKICRPEGEVRKADDGSWIYEWDGRPESLSKYSNDKLDVMCYEISVRALMCTDSEIREDFRQKAKIISDERYKRLPYLGSTNNISQQGQINSRGIWNVLYAGQKIYGKEDFTGSIRSSTANHATRGSRKERSRRSAT